MNNIEEKYNLLQKNYDALLEQNKSLQQYPKLFNDHIFKGLTPEEVIAAAKVQIIKTMEEKRHEV